MNMLGRVVLFVISVGLLVSLVALREQRQQIDALTKGGPEMAQKELATLQPGDIVVLEIDGGVRILMAASLDDEMMLGAPDGLPWISPSREKVVQHFRRIVRRNDPEWAIHSFCLTHYPYPTPSPTP